MGVMVRFNAYLTDFPIDCETLIVYLIDFVAITGALTKYWMLFVSAEGVVRTAYAIDLESEYVVVVSSVVSCLTSRVGFVVPEYELA